MTVFAILSQRTSHVKAKQAFDHVLSSFSTWRSVHEASPDYLHELIHMTNHPKVKVERLQGALRAIDIWCDGNFSLKHLHRMGTEEAMAWLIQLPGVRYKTGSCTLLMSTTHRRVLPVDTGHTRVMKRLGVIPCSVSWDDAHILLLCLLPGPWTATDVEMYHDVVKRLSEMVCTEENPRCVHCPLLQMCDTGRRRMAGWEDCDPAQSPKQRRQRVNQLRFCLN